MRLNTLAYHTKRSSSPAVLASKIEVPSLFRLKICQSEKSHFRGQLERSIDVNLVAVRRRWRGKSITRFPLLSSEVLLSLSPHCKAERTWVVSHWFWNISEARHREWSGLWWTTSRWSSATPRLRFQRLQDFAFREKKKDVWITNSIIYLFESVLFVSTDF